MNVLAGVIPSSKGKILVNGYDVRKDIGKVRSSLGLCPQHNILNDDMTVAEHLLFYGRLKGLI